MNTGINIFQTESDPLITLATQQADIFFVLIQILQIYCFNTLVITDFELRQVQNKLIN